MVRQTKLAVAYCRVSTDHEEQKKSIQEQKAEWLEKFSENGSKNARVGMLCRREITHVDENGKVTKGKYITELRTDGLYIDEGISGKSVRNRKAFQQMIEDAKLKKFDMIFVEDVSRFSRSMEDGYNVIKDLRDIGVGVYFRKEGWDSLDTTKEFELQLRLSLAQEDNRAKSERIKWALDRLRQKGGWSSTPACGYDKVNGFLQKNEEEAKYVQMVFDWFTVEHWGQGKIARKLNEIGAPSKRGGAWRDRQIQKMLRNVIYTGKQVTHRVETYDITRRTYKEIDPNEWVVTQNEDLRIISDDTFELAQVEYDRHSELFRRGARQSSTQLLSGILYCAHCGSSFSRKKKNHHVRKDGTVADKGYVWTCHIYDAYGGANKVGGICSGERIQVIEDDCIKAIQYDIKCLKSSNTDSFFNHYLEEKYKDLEGANIDDLKEKETALNGEMRQLRQDRRDSLIDEDVYKEQMSELNTEIGSVKTNISRLERLEEDKSHLIELYKAYKKTIQEVDVDNLTNSVLKTIYYKIIVSYRKDATGKKTPTLHFIYKFLDSTNDDIIRARSELDDANLKVFQSLYLYKKEEELNEQMANNGLI